jgi:hypothetical protein
LKEASVHHSVKEDERSEHQHEQKEEVEEQVAISEPHHVEAAAVSEHH